MVARCDKLEVMISDNGTNFTLAGRELRDLVLALDQARIKENATNEGIHWHFYSRGRSHHGGLFKSLIKSAKKALCAILEEYKTTE